MTTYAPFDRDQPFLLPPDLKDWLPEDDLAHFIVAAAERVRLGAFGSNRQAGGKPQYHPRLMLALRVYCYATGIFSSRRIERATYRDIRRASSPPTRIPITIRSRHIAGPTRRRSRRRF